ncbi:MAG: hypothetical protein GWP91_11215, partial [Rhodobacterales bacterium]|nr:hypothetical protein [Rhodobacterales bacterium]
MSPPPRRISAAQQRLLVLVLTLLFIAIASISFNTVVDDAFISARYAQMLSVGHGVRYNVEGPPIEGVTNLAWVWWLAIAHWTGVSVHAWMVSSGLLFGVLCVPLSYLLARRLSPEPDRAALLLAPAMLALSPHFAVASTNGLETSAFVAGLLAVSIGLLDANTPGSRARAGFALFLLGALRPEGLLLAPLAIGFNALRDGRNVWPTALTWTVCIQVLLTWRWLTFTALLPNTGAAKLAKTWTQQLEHNANYLSTDGPWWLLVLLFGLWTCAGSTRRILAPWLVTAAALLIVASRVELWMPGARLVLPAFALIAVCLAVHLSVTPDTWSVFPMISVLITAIALGPQVRRYDAVHSVQPKNGTATAMAALSQHLLPGDTLVVRDAGVLAYYAGPQTYVFETHK